MIVTSGSCRGIPANFWVAMMRSTNRISVRHLAITLSTGALGALAMLAVIISGTVIWDYSRVRNKEDEYQMLYLGMKEEHVIDLLGPPFHSTVEVVEARLFEKHVANNQGKITVARRSWVMNHYMDFYLEFDTTGVLIHISPPCRFGDRYPTLTRISERIEYHSDRLKNARDTIIDCIW